LLIFCQGRSLHAWTRRGPLHSYLAACGSHTRLGVSSSFHWLKIRESLQTFSRCMTKRFASFKIGCHFECTAVACLVSVLRCLVQSSSRPDRLHLLDGLNTRPKPFTIPGAGFDGTSVDAIFRCSSLKAAVLVASSSTFAEV
jgi:hypothetical protein